MKHIFIFSILFSFCATSCYTLKPDSKFATSPNYNNQVTVTKPKFVKKNNPIGISIQIATPIIAGAAMYQFAPSVVQYQSGAETKNFQPANAAIGILGMLAINKIVNYAFGYNRVKPMRAYEVDKWMKKTNLQEKYNYIAETEGYKIQLIPKTQETDFTVNTTQDVLYYKALFPLATQENIAKVIQNGTTNLAHEDLTTLVHYYPNHEEVNATKIKYIETARTYNELWDRINKYTEAKVDREQLSANLIVLEMEYDDFKLKIPNSSYASVIENKLIDIDNRSFAEFSSINTKDGYHQYLNKFLRPHNKELALQKIAEIEEEERRIAEQKRLEEIARQEQARKEREAAEERERKEMEKLNENRRLIKTYVSISNETMAIKEGDGYTLWETVKTSLGLNLKKVNIMVMGKVKNSYELPLNVKIKVDYRITTKVERGGAWGMLMGNSKSTSTETREFYATIPAHTTIPFLTLLKSEFSTQTSVYGNTLIGSSLESKIIDDKQPYILSIEYCEYILNRNIEDQNSLIEKVRSTGNAEIKENFTRESYYEKPNFNSDSKNKVKQRDNLEGSKNDYKVNIKKDIDTKSTLSIEDYKKGNYEVPIYTEKTEFKDAFSEHIRVKINENLNFMIYYNPKCQKYYHKESAVKSYYKTKEDVIKSVYGYKVSGSSYFYNFGNDDICK